MTGDHGEPPPTPAQHAAVLRTMMPFNTAGFPAAISFAIQALDPTDHTSALITLAGKYRAVAVSDAAPTEVARLAMARAQAIEAALAVLGPGATP